MIEWVCKRWKLVARFLRENMRACVRVEVSWSVDCITSLCVVHERAHTHSRARESRPSNYYWQTHQSQHVSLAKNDIVAILREGRPLFFYLDSANHTLVVSGSHKANIMIAICVLTQNTVPPKQTDKRGIIAPVAWSSMLSGQTGVGELQRREATGREATEATGGEMSQRGERTR